MFVGGGRGDRVERWGCFRGKGGGCEGVGMVWVGICFEGRWLKADSGCFGSVVVVDVVRWARRGRRNVGGRVTLGEGS